MSFQNQRLCGLLNGIPLTVPIAIVFESTYRFHSSHGIDLFGFLRFFRYAVLLAEGVVMRRSFVEGRPFVMVSMHVSLRFVAITPTSFVFVLKFRTLSDRCCYATHVLNIFCMQSQLFHSEILERILSLSPSLSLFLSFSFTFSYFSYASFFFRYSSSFVVLELFAWLFFLTTKRFYSTQYFRWLLKI